MVEIYLITDRGLFSNDGEFYSAIEDALRAGVRMLQLREKGLGERPLLDMAYRLRELTNLYSARLFINNRADLALCIGADGVHLGQTGMAPDVVRGIIKDGMQIGVSTHSLAEAALAEAQGADFITFGPVFETPSKAAYGPPVGLSNLKEVVSKVALPIFAIGGIKTHNLQPVIGAGVRGIALISGILSSSGVYSTTKQYLSIIGGAI